MEKLNSSKNRRRMKRLRIVAWALFAAGLFLFSLYTNRQERPLVQIGKIKPSMNFSTICVRGILASDARKLQSGEILYMVDDGTGKLPVFLAQASEEKLPKAGSRVIVEGNISMGAGHAIRMRTPSAGQIVVEPLIPMEEVIGKPRLADVTADRKGERVVICGQVSKVWTARLDSKAPHKIVLTDPSGSLDVIHWFEPKLALALGDVLEVRGMVDVYRGHPQLKVWEADHIRLWSE